MPDLEAFDQTQLIVRMLDPNQASGLGAQPLVNASYGLEQGGAVIANPRADLKDDGASLKPLFNKFDDGAGKLIQYDSSVNFCMEVVTKSLDQRNRIKDSFVLFM